MNKRIFGMAPGGRMNLDKAANRRRAVRFSTAQRKTRKEAEQRAEEQAGRLPELQEAERPELRGFFDGLLRDLVQGTPREGAGAPTGLVNDPALRGDREPGEATSNRLGAWLGLRGAE